MVRRVGWGRLELVCALRKSYGCAKTGTDGVTNVSGKFIIVSMIARCLDWRSALREGYESDLSVVKPRELEWNE